MFNSGSPPERLLARTKRSQQAWVGLGRERERVLFLPEGRKIQCVSMRGGGGGRGRGE